ncbi:hypothetical protein [Microbacterium sp. 179-I 3D4 NHS]|uniref:hypothetical protein n=1 Tax=Microbacterium sp. 179-I 3D4 NHS TaxID=3142381 RepID=UPI0039A3CA5F
MHVALPHSASRFDPDGVRVHRARGPVPVPRFATDEHPLNVLFPVARCLPRPDALAIWEAAVRRDAVDLDVIERVAWRSERAAALAALRDYTVLRFDYQQIMHDSASVRATILDAVAQGLHLA